MEQSVNKNNMVATFGNGLTLALNNNSSPTPGAPKDEKKDENVEKSFDPTDFFEDFKEIDKLDVGYVVYTKMINENGRTAENAINIEDFNNENQSVKKDEKGDTVKGDTTLGVKIPSSEIYELSINNEDFIFKRKTPIKQLLQNVEKDKEINKSENNGNITNTEDYEKYIKQLEKIKDIPEEDKITSIIKEFVQINPSIFGESDDYVTAYVYDNPEHHNEVAEIKVRVSKNEEGNETAESYKFNALPNQLYDSNFIINPLIVGIFDLWKNSILYKARNKKEITKVEESLLYEDSNEETNNSNVNQQNVKINSNTVLNEEVNEYNIFVKNISSKVKQLYGSYIAIDNNKNIDGVFINSDFYSDEIKDSDNFENFNNIGFIKQVTKLMKQKNKTPPKKEGGYYTEFDNILKLDRYLKLENNKTSSEDIYKEKFNIILEATKKLTMLEEEYIYAVREKLVRMFNEYKTKKYLEKEELGDIKSFLNTIFVANQNDKMLDTPQILYAAYYAYTLVKIIKNKLIDKMSELSDLLDNSNEDSESKESNTDEKFYYLVENFIELNGSYPSEDDIEKYKNVIKQLKINKNNMNKVETYLKERLNEKGVLDSQYTIGNVELVYDNDSGEGLFDKIKKITSVLFGKKYITTKDFLSNRKIKGSIFEEAIKYSYLTKYYEKMYGTDDKGKDKKTEITPSHPRVTEEIKKIIEVIPAKDRIDLNFISKESTMDVGIFFGLNPQSILTSLNENKKFTNEFKQDAWLSKTYFTGDNEIASSVIVKGSETVGYIQAYSKFKIIKSLLNKFRGR